jgi:hypothetical protein
MKLIFIFGGYTFIIYLLIQGEWEVGQVLRKSSQVQIELDLKLSQIEYCEVSASLSFPRISFHSKFPN